MNTMAHFAQGLGKVGQKTGQSRPGPTLPAWGAHFALIKGPLYPQIAYTTCNVLYLSVNIHYRELELQ